MHKELPPKIFFQLFACYLFWSNVMTVNFWIGGMRSNLTPSKMVSHWDATCENRLNNVTVILHYCQRFSSDGLPVISSTWSRAWQHQCNSLSQIIYYYCIKVFTASFDATATLFMPPPSILCHVLSSSHSILLPPSTSSRSCTPIPTFCTPRWRTTPHRQHCYCRHSASCQGAGRRRMGREWNKWQQQCWQQ